MVIVKLSLVTHFCFKFLFKKNRYYFLLCIVSSFWALFIFAYLLYCYMLWSLLLFSFCDAFNKILIDYGLKKRSRREERFQKKDWSTSFNNTFFLPQFTLCALALLLFLLLETKTNLFPIFNLISKWTFKVIIKQSNSFIFILFDDKQRSYFAINWQSKSKPESNTSQN